MPTPEQLNLEFNPQKEEKKYEDRDTAILRRLIKKILLDKKGDKNFKFSGHDFTNIFFSYLLETDKIHLRDDIHSNPKMTEIFDLELNEKIAQIIKEEGGQYTKSMGEQLINNRKKINKRLRDWPTFAERSMPKD